MEAYVTGVGGYLPNEPISNEDIERLLGMIEGRPSRTRELILKRNGINTRYYARDPHSGRQTHSNAQLTAEAVRRLARASGLALEEIDLLACGTSSADQIVPGHASMVHGELRCPSCEVVSTTGVCCSGMAALKYASLAVRAGTARHAVACGSELASSWLQAGAFPGPRRAVPVDADPHIAFEQEFLRWMLSDGAGAVLIEGQPRPGKPSLRIDWLDIISLANELDTCMYCGAVKAADGTLRTWRGLERFDTAWSEGYLNLTQDVKLLKDKIIVVGFRRSFAQVRDKYRLSPERIDWWLPHLSSELFRRPTQQMLAELDFAIPPEKWYTNLPQKGNTGSASIYLMLEELWSSGALRPGDHVLCGVPESARFTFAYMHCTVV
jgi:3-oxoacyl-[acyl-carrier-protein] synthase-3